MTRHVPRFLLLAAALAAAPALLADVKTTEKSSMKLEGMMGMMPGMRGTETTATVALKGDRMSRLSDGTGEIVDLTGQKFYMIDGKKKEYTVMTFAERRKQLEDALKQMKEQQKSMSQANPGQFQETGKELEFDVDVKTPDQHKTIAGHDARQVILTLTMREKGKKIEESGGFVMVNDMWLAARVPAIDELNAFQMKLFKAVYEGLFSSADMQGAQAMTAMLPGYGALAGRMTQERGKLQGTLLASVSTMETVKSAEQMKQASQQPQQQGGGGLGGMLAGRMGGNRGGSTEPRSKMATMTSEYVAIGTAVTEADVAIPAGFKEKK